ncbi:MAG: purine-nucleoside phosphorylase [Alphaproteobacteria bacterium]|nr:purine-nucleoside phosphorylase [Alphaproteobacteria bacterium]
MIQTYAENILNELKGKKPEVLMILGSGLGSLANQIEDKTVIPYEKIGFPKSGVSGHAGCLVVGKMGKHEVVCMQGRFHLYEGHNPELIKNVMCAFKTIGVKTLIVTNAAGSLNADMPAGSLMLINDHINFSGKNPLLGANDEKYGPRFVDLSSVYDSDLQNKLKNIALQKGIKLYEGVYLMVLGPNFETAAEIRAFKILGADAVGMSTVPEVMSAVYTGMKVLGVSVITNLGTGLKTSVQSHAETLEQAQKATQKLSDLLKAYMEE